MLLLHVGLHKTGSTTLQKILPKLCRHDHHNIFIPDGYKKLLDLEKQEEWCNSLIKMSRQKNVILSSEGALGSMANLYEDLPERVRLIAKRFKNANDLKIILCLREPLSWIESLYAQKINEGYSITTQEYVHNICLSNYCGYRNIIDQLYRYIDKSALKVVVYGGSAVQDILLEMGFSSDLIYPYLSRKNFNESAKGASLELFRRMNKFSTPAESRVLRDYFQSDLRNYSLKSIFSHDQQEILIKRFQKDWLYVMAEYGVGMENSLKIKPSIHDSGEVCVDLLETALEILKDQLIEGHKFRFSFLSRLMRLLRRRFCELSSAKGRSH